MTLHTSLKIFMLRALLQMSGSPMPQTSLYAAAENAYPSALQSDMDLARRDLEREGYISGDTDELTSIVTWTLTAKGSHRAKLHS
jgi:hypothetical protein